jgi:hypothetical protein
MSQFTALIIGALSASTVALIGVVAARSRTRAETQHLGADSADLISQAATRLIPFYDAQLKMMEVRLSKAETDSASAADSAARALAREAACLSRMNEMQIQLDQLRRDLDTATTNQGD